MVATQQNYLDIKLPTLKVGSIFKAIDKYITMLKTLNSIRKIYKLQFNNFKFYIMAHNLDTIEKVDNMAIKLEGLSDIHNNLLEDTELQRWYAYPLYYLVDRIEDWNMASQGLLMSLDVELMKKDKQLNTKEI